MKEQNTMFSLRTETRSLILSAVGRILPPPRANVHTLIPGSCGHVMLHGKGTLKSQVELRVLISWPDIRSLDYPGAPTVTVRGFAHGKGQQGQCQSNATCKDPHPQLSRPNWLWLWKGHGPRISISPRPSRRSTALPILWFRSSETPVGLLIYGTVR